MFTEVHASSFWQEKNVLITGASSGIGEALSIELALLGARVAMFARRADRLERIAQQIQRDGGEALPLPGDASQRDDVRRAAGQVNAQWGPVDVLVANAGRGMHGENETDGNTVQEVYGVNFLGAVYALEAVLPSMRSRGQGHIAAISSGTALLPRLAASHAYASSKAAMGRYFEGLGRELRLEGISVTVVYPGFVRTEMTSGHTWMPFVIEADRAAHLIRRAIERGKRRLVFPRRTFWLGRMVQLIPIRLQLRGRNRYSGVPRSRQ